MARFFPCILLAIGFISWQGNAWSQGVRSAGIASGQATRPPAPRADPGFAFRLGSTVGLQAIPPVTMPPGVGNINHPGHPGMQPLPMVTQPLPTGSPFPIPNINFPGGVPGTAQPPQPKPDRRVPGRFRRAVIGVGPIIYVPYYIPVYTGTVYPGTAPATTPAVSPPPDAGPSGGVRIYPIQPPSETQPQPPQSSVAPAARPVTLLAFKDHTIIAVTDYWLEGDSLVYETSPGTRTAVPLERLDWVLTQQLNRERNVRFVLEARP